MWKFVAFLVVAFCLYLAFRDDSPKPTPALAPPVTSVSSDSSTRDADDPEPMHSSSGEWGSGHQAGYDWAQENGIDDESACETAGDSHNSPSFAEGCTAYVQEQ
jgi:hypothetical protein